MSTEPQAFTRKCFVDLSKISASTGSPVVLSLRAMLKDVSFTSGGTTLNSNTLLNDGSIPVLESEAKTTISVSGYATSIGNQGGEIVNAIRYLLGLDNLFYQGTDETDPLAVDSNSPEPSDSLIRLIWLWTNDTTATDAMGDTAANTYSLRRTYANGYLVGPPSFEWTGDPKVLEMSADFEFVPRNKFGFPNYHFESAVDNALPALTDYNVATYGERVATRTW